MADRTPLSAVSDLISALITFRQEYDPKAVTISPAVVSAAKLELRAALKVLKTPEPAADTESKLSGCAYVKRSQVTDQGRCNFVWGIPDASVPNRHDKLLQDLTALFKSEDAVMVRLQITNSQGVILRTYSMSVAFVLQYFEHLELGKGTTHNMGCHSCACCGEFLRLKHLENASKLRNLIDWTTFFHAVPSQCKTDDRRVYPPVFCVDP